MGFGFRCGFLGLLHMEIVQERLEREYDLDLIITAPTVVYKAMLTDGEEVTVDNPCLLPEAARREYISEPYVRSAVFFSVDHSVLQSEPDVRSAAVNVSLHYSAEHFPRSPCGCVLLHWLACRRYCS